MRGLKGRCGISNLVVKEVLRFVVKIINYLFLRWFSQTISCVCVFGFFLFWLKSLYICRYFRKEFEILMLIVEGKC